MTVCKWTGREFPYRKGKVFVDSHAKRDYHTATRLYTEYLVDQGALNVEWLRGWFYKQKEKPYTADTEATTDIKVVE